MILIIIWGSYALLTNVSHEYLCAWAREGTFGAVLGLGTMAREIVWLAWAAWVAGLAESENQWFWTQVAPARSTPKSLTRGSDARYASQSAIRVQILESVSWKFSGFAKRWPRKNHALRTSTGKPSQALWKRKSMLWNSHNFCEAHFRDAPHVFAVRTFKIGSANFTLSLPDPTFAWLAWLDNFTNCSWWLGWGHARHENVRIA